MNEIASPGQLRLAFLRWALLFVPLVVLLGFGVSNFSGSGEENRWFQALIKPEAQPPGAAFGIAWSILYVMMGLALTVVVTARGARLRGLAVLLFFVQLGLNLAWPIYFFRMHQVSGAFYLLVGVFVAAFATTIVFGRIRSLAAWLMVPYLAWLCFASVLNKQIDELNPNAEQLVVPRDAQRIQLAPPSP
ncbi:TspO/MBR related protein [Blastomonas natatoria]|uniref:TspO/MBR related protein n=1 Tax=Blastomonas natatoria TaxID=34015 RepID=A0A2V3VBS5_9SPHN|nr:TspO/MBR family protein [Blastomonas natatoria]PXW79030.1 TspO/MBR related protein [Blastomonas natatoria]